MFGTLRQTVFFWGGGYCKTRESLTVAVELVALLLRVWKSQFEYGALDRPYYARYSVFLLSPSR